MKIGHKTYTKDEMLIIESFKKHIQTLQKEIDDHWETLCKHMHDSENQKDFLFDYVLNDVKVKYD